MKLRNLGFTSRGERRQTDRETDRQTRTIEYAADWPCTLAQSVSGIALAFVLLLLTGVVQEEVCWLLTRSRYCLLACLRQGRLLLLPTTVPSLERLTDLGSFSKV